MDTPIRCRREIHPLYLLERLVFGIWRLSLYTVISQVSMENTATLSFCLGLGSVLEQPLPLCPAADKISPDVPPTDKSVSNEWRTELQLPDCWIIWSQVLVASP